MSSKNQNEQSQTNLEYELYIVATLVASGALIHHDKLTPAMGALIGLAIGYSIASFEDNI